MNDIILMLLIGFVAGGAVSSIIWAIVGAGRKKKLEAEETARKDVMDTIVTLLADADGIEAKYRNGELSVENFRRNLGDKCNAALKTLRENMNGLDGFFVRYADQEIREYLRAADNPERRKARPALESQSGRPVEPGAQAAPPVGSIGAVIQTFTGSGMAPAPSAAPPTLKVIDAPPPPPKTNAETKGKPDLFEPSRPLQDSAPKIALKPVAEPAAIEPKPEPVVIKPEPEPVAIEPKPEPVIIKPEPKLDVIEPKPEPAVIKPEPELDVIEPKPEPAVIKPEPELAPEPVEEESVFDLPVTLPAGGDVWSEQSIEDFEAAFARFEEDAEPLPPPPKAEREELAETGRFPLPDALDEFETPTMEIPISAVQAAATVPPVSPVPPAPSVAPPAPQKEEKQQGGSNLGITGDDVSDALDSMFKM